MILIATILEDRAKLKIMLVHEHEAIINKVKATYYNLNNKAGAYLAKLVKIQAAKKKIVLIQHPSTKSILTNPQDIANAFGTYN